jgi:hypothetical protein
MKGIAIVGMTIIHLSAISFRYKFLFILSEIILLHSIILTIKRREIGKINKFARIICFVLLMLFIARVVVFE